MTPLTQLLETSREEFDERFVMNISEGMLKGHRAMKNKPTEIKEFQDSLITRAYELGQQNPLTGFLRQYLNERYGIPENLWTDEQLLKFLRIPFTGSALDRDIGEVKE